MAGTLELPEPRRPLLVLFLKGDPLCTAKLPEKMAIMCKNTCMFPQLENRDTLPTDLWGVQGESRLASLTTQTEQLAAKSLAVVPDAHIFSDDAPVRMHHLDAVAGVPVLGVCPQKFKALRDGFAGLSGSFSSSVALRQEDL